MVQEKKNKRPYTTNGSFGETINKFQDCDIKNIKTLQRKQNLKTVK